MSKSKQPDSVSHSLPEEVDSPSDQSSTNRQTPKEDASTDINDTNNSPRNNSPLSETPPVQPDPKTAELTSQQWQEKYQAAQQEASQAQDQALRSQAELENFKKRILREQEEALRYANAAILKDFLGALDNLERAIAATHTNNSSGGKALQEGVSMVANQIQEIFSRHGMEPIHAQPEAPFDPDSQEAISTATSNIIKAGHIIDVFQVGWRYHQRVLRPARVSVAKSPDSDNLGKVSAGKEKK